MEKEIESRIIGLLATLVLSSPILSIHVRIVIEKYLSEQVNFYVSL
jgi:hypothetical protein